MHPITCMQHMCASHCRPECCFTAYGYGRGLVIMSGHRALAENCPPPHPCRPMKERACPFPCPPHGGSYRAWCPKAPWGLLRPPSLVLKSLPATAHRLRSPDPEVEDGRTCPGLLPILLALASGVQTCSPWYTQTWTHS